VIEIAVRFAATGVRTGRVMIDFSLLPARIAVDAARPRLQERAEATLDALLAGPLTEHVARSLSEHRVVERAAQQLIEQGTVASLLDQALKSGLGEQIAERLLASDVLESRLLVELTDRLMASEEVQHVISHLASSPELRAAIAEQTSGLTEEMIAGVRRRSVSLDDVAERTVRGWLRRPRPQPT
jgi:hypothetical protein